MKNSSLTKALLCGVMATTFFLINCQKAPNRGIKANGGSSGATADAAKLAAEANGLLVECPADFATKYTAAKKSVTDLSSMDLGDIKTNESKKADVKSKLSEANDQVREIISNIKSVKADAVGCKVTDSKTGRGTATYLNSEISNQLNGLVEKIKTAGGDVDEKVSQDKESDLKDQAAQKARLAAQQSAEGIDTSMSFTVATELAKVLKQSNVKAVYFKNGDIITEGTNLEADKANKSLSMCELGTADQDAPQGEKAKVTSLSAVTKDAASGRYKMSVGLVIKDATIMFNCLIADNMQLKGKKAFREVFKKLLVSDAQIKMAQDQQAKLDNSALGQAKADAASKLESLKNATKVVENVQAEIAANQKDLDAAIAAKDDAKRKEFSDKDTGLKAKLDGAQKDKIAAQKAKDDADAAVTKAQADADAAAKKS